MDAATADEDEARWSDVIFRKLEEVERLRSHGQLPLADAATRAYEACDGDLICVLDRHDAPLSPQMLEAIQMFLEKDASDANAVTSDPVNSDHRLTASNSAAKDNAEQDPNNGGDAAGSVAAESTIDAAAAATADAITGVAETCHQQNETHDVNVEMRETNDQRVDEDGESAAVVTVSTVKKPPPDPSTSVDASETASIAMVPWMSSAVHIPEELIQSGRPVSTWLDSSTMMRSETHSDQDQDQQLRAAATNEPADSALEDSALPTYTPAEDFASLCERWPLELEARREIFYCPSPDAAASFAPRSHRRAPCILYWMRNTLRVTHGNFSLETALHLSQRLAIPVVTLCLVPSAIMYPTCHASNVDDAYARWSFATIHRQLQRARLPFIGVTGKSSRKRPSDQDDCNDEGFALFKLLDVFSPHVVVTDNAFDVHARRDLDQLSQFLHATPASSPWALLAIDSSSCTPICSKSDKVQSTLRSPGEQYLYEDDFGREYARHSQNDFQPYAFTAIDKVPAKPSVPDLDYVDRAQLARLLRDLWLEQVNWSIIEPMNTQNSPEMVPFSEMDALQKLDRLLAEFNDRPAIQAELQGEGVMSLLPYIRHGTLFSGHIIHQISAAISSQSPPWTAQARKALAALKVMRSRAFMHLGKERDYALYLSLWTSIQQKPDNESALPAPAYGSFAKCFTLDRLHAFSASSSALNTKFGAETTSGQKNDPGLGAAIYDPYELESARTNDLYWNDIQKFLTKHRYIHPLLIVYWSYRILQWSVSSRAAIAMIESLLHKNALGARSSPDIVFSVWNQLFRLGKPSLLSENEDGVRTFQRLTDEEVSSQPRLQLHP
ncbi:hypothetical protein FI667_g15785, partial [Globisporangium splendens]